MDELYRPGSPPAHAIYTIERAKARRELPPRLVPAPRRFLMLRGPRNESFAYPRPAARAFFGNVFAQGTAPGAANTFSSGASALETTEVEKTSKTTSLLAEWPGRHPAAEASHAVIVACFSSLHGVSSPFKRKASQTTHKAGSRKPWPSSVVE
jgi:hypothetical protein